MKIDDEICQMMRRISRCCFTAWGSCILKSLQASFLNDYKVEIELSRPKVAFRETIRKNSDVEYKYKKQSGGHGQYGHVKMRFSPSGNLEEPYEFEQVVVEVLFRRTTSRG